MKDWCEPDQAGGSCRRLKSRIKILYSFMYMGRCSWIAKNFIERTGNAFIF